MAPEPTTPLRAWRQSLGVSIRELERRTNISRARLSVIERGVPPRQDELALIARALTEAPK